MNLLSKTCLFFVSTCFLFTGCQKKNRSDIATSTPVVLTTWVLEEEVADQLEFKGTLIPSQKINVESEVDGRIVKMEVNEGSRVSSGDLVVEIESELLKLALEKLKKELQETQIRLELTEISRQNPPEKQIKDKPTNEDLNPEETNAAPRSLDEVGEEVLERSEEKTAQDQERDTKEIPLTLSENQEALGTLYRASIDRIEAEIQLTEKKLEMTKITAQTSGIVTDKNFSEGSIVHSRDLLFSIINLDPIILSIFVPEEFRYLFDRGQSLDVFLPATRQTLKGEVLFVGFEPHAQNRNYAVQIAIPNSNWEIPAGVSAGVSLPLERKRKALLVPTQAILQEGRSFWVYQVQDDRARRVSVEIGAWQKGNRVEVKRGLKKNDLVIWEGQDAVQGPEQKVNPKTAEPE